MTTVARQTDALHAMTTSQLVARFNEVHGYPTRTRHRRYLIRKIAWRLQANAEGDLSERARRRAEELADDAEVRVMAPPTMVCPPQPGTSLTVSRAVPPERDPRLPAPGSVIVREYKGRTLRVLVLEDGFECDGERYASLSAVARAVTGSHLNGFRFFRLRSSS